VKFHRCERCGAPAKSATARCSACGVTPVIIASGFGNAPDTWEVTPPIDKTRVVVLDDNELRAGMPPRSEVAGWVMGCAWTRGDYVDVDVTAPIVFESTPARLGAGIWLRSSTQGSIQIMVDYRGVITTAVERLDAEPPKLEWLGRELAAAPGFAAGATTVLRARLVGDVLSVFVDGIPRGSWRCPTNLTGGVSLFVNVAESERSIVRFLDPSVTLPM
jgi:hypothetical protein